MKIKTTVMMIIALVLASCSPKTTDLIWVDQYNNPVPVILTREHDTTFYDFGTIIMMPDTTFKPDTINEIKH